MPVKYASKDAELLHDLARRYGGANLGGDGGPPRDDRYDTIDDVDQGCFICHVGELIVAFFGVLIDVRQ
jgi:hypothetical protein